MSTDQQIKDLMKSTSNRGKLFIQKSGTPQCPQIFESIKSLTPKQIEKTLEQHWKLHAITTFFVNHILNQRVFIVIEDARQFKKNLAFPVVQFLVSLYIMYSSLLTFVRGIINERSVFHCALIKLFEEISIRSFQWLSMEKMKGDYWPIVQNFGYFVVVFLLALRFANRQYRQAMKVWTRRVDLKELAEIYHNELYMEYYD